MCCGDADTRNEQRKQGAYCVVRDAAEQHSDEVDTSQSAFSVSPNLLYY